MNFDETEKKSYSGEYVDYDSLPADEYKYFTRVAALGRDARAGRKTPAEVVSLRAAYLDEYNRSRGKMSWPEIIKVTESLRVHINGNDNPRQIAVLALHALWMITGDEMLKVKEAKLNEQP